MTVVSLASPPRRGRAARLAAGVAIALIRCYRFAFAPVSRGACRFDPTCSAYALEAIERHGAWRGFGLAFRRLLRCHPLGPSGWDPVP